MIMNYTDYKNDYRDYDYFGPGDWDDDRDLDD